MANNVFDRDIENELEKPRSDFVNGIGSYADYTARARARMANSQRNTATGDAEPVNGFEGAGFRLKPGAVGLSVKIMAGLGWFYDAGSLTAAIAGIGGLSDFEPYKPLVLTADTADIALGAAPGAGQERYDLIEARYMRRIIDATATQVFDNALHKFVPGNVVKRQSWKVDDQIGTVLSPMPSTNGISVKQGVNQAVGTGLAGVPATTSGYLPIGVVYVGPAQASVVASQVIDKRPLVHPDGVVPFWLRVVLTGPSGSPAVSLLAGLPPGVQAGVLAAGAGAGSVYIVAGDTSLWSIAGLQALLAGTNVGVIPATSLAGANIVIFIGTASSGLQTSLPLVIGVGQKYIEIGYQLVEAQDGGAVGFGASDLPNFFNLHIAGALRRN
jgi:hypothetical protein